jgi:glutamate-1-semialdehyde 2,1-aminomutase
VVYSKAVGGGLPISILAGRKRFMNLIATNEVRHGGTYNGNSLCACAALHTLDELSKPEFQSQLKASGGKIMAALDGSARKHHVPCVVLGVEQMFQVVFGMSTPPRHYRDLLKADFERYDKFRHSLLTRGVHVTHSALAAWFLSIAHTSEDIELTADAIEQAMKEIS